MCDETRFARRSGRGVTIAVLVSERSRTGRGSSPPAARAATRRCFTPSLTRSRRLRGCSSIRAEAACTMLGRSGPGSQILLGARTGREVGAQLPDDGMVLQDPLSPSGARRLYSLAHRVGANGLRPFGVPSGHDRCLPARASAVGALIRRSGAMRLLYGSNGPPQPEQAHPRSRLPTQTTSCRTADRRSISHQLASSALGCPDASVVHPHRSRSHPLRGQAAAWRLVLATQTYGQTFPYGTRRASSICDKSFHTLKGGE